MQTEVGESTKIQAASFLALEEGDYPFPSEKGFKVNTTAELLVTWY